MTGCQAVAAWTAPLPAPQTLESMCLGYLAGFWAALTLENSGKHICPRGPITVGQLATIYSKWAADNPAEWHLPEGTTVGRALTLAFPCS
ncbi:Rap1a/Tai family immunity protein [Hyphomicrobium sp.]|uniref:Rap1a/Tai family immunity protein n=1 Tax=Hyphomicrobium sp. TaxID=82 RepID=UPI00345B85BE